MNMNPVTSVLSSPKHFSAPKDFLLILWDCIIVHREKGVRRWFPNPARGLSCHSYFNLSSTSPAQSSAPKALSHQIFVEDKSSKKRLMLGEKINSCFCNSVRHEHQENLDHLLWSVNPRISFGIGVEFLLGSMELGIGMVLCWGKWFWAPYLGSRILCYCNEFLCYFVGYLVGV